MKATRVATIGAAAAALLVSIAPLTASATATGSTAELLGSGSTLRSLAAPDGIRIGTAVNMDALASDSTYAQIASTQFSTVTPENVMKWQVVEPTQGTYDWSQADKLVAFAQANHQLVRGHTLVWHNQLPDWLTTGIANNTFTKDQLRALLKKHIVDEVSHFRGKIWQWDVVNEAFNDDGTLRQTPWLTALGPGYIADAFRWAHQADPHALLFYNDYNIEGGVGHGGKADAVYAMLKQLRAQGVPVNGVGIQGHLDTQYGFWGDAVANAQRFADLGLFVAYTEVDVRYILPTTSIETNLENQAQAEGYSNLLRACLLVRTCLSYTVWGFADKYSWVPGVFSGEGNADLWDANYQPKQALQTIREDLALGAARHRD